MSATFLPVYFLCLKGSTLKTRKNVFISLRKFFLFLRSSSFNFSDIQMSWRHQMSKHETRNILYGITWEVNTVWWWNSASLCRVTKEQFLTKKYVKNVAWKLVPGSLIFKESSLKKNFRRSVCWFWQVLIVLLIYI